MITKPTNSVRYPPKVVFICYLRALMQKIQNSGTNYLYPIKFQIININFNCKDVIQMDRQIYFSQNRKDIEDGTAALNLSYLQRENFFKTFLQSYYKKWQGTKKVCYIVLRSCTLHCSKCYKTCLFSSTKYQPLKEKSAIMTFQWYHLSQGCIYKTQYIPS